MKSGDEKRATATDNRLPTTHPTKAQVVASKGRLMKRLGAEKRDVEARTSEVDGERVGDRSADRLHRNSGKNRESRVGNELARAMQGLGILMRDGQHEGEVAVPAESKKKRHGNGAPSRPTSSARWHCASLIRGATTPGRMRSSTLGRKPGVFGWPAGSHGKRQHPASRKLVAGAGTLCRPISNPSGIYHQGSWEGIRVKPERVTAQARGKHYNI